MLLLSIGVACALALAYITLVPDSPVRESAAAPATAGTDHGTDTEFCAEVVRITEVLPHGNADRLEIARFEMKTGPSTYEVVIGKGQYKVGDLAAYLSVDCLVPLALPQFKFLADRLDGKGKTHYRLKAARLRGVFSQGLLVEAPKDAQLGDSVAKAFEVEYYRSPDEDGGPGTSISRNDQRINRNSAQPMPVYGVESLKKLPNLFAEGEPVAITEKIHGTNFRFGWLPKKFLGFRIGWKFVVGSHRVIKGNGGKGHWYGDDIWLATAEKFGLAERTKKHKGLAFYAEIFGFSESGKKIQDLTYGKTGPAIAVFDVRHNYGGTWLTFDERVALCTELDLPTVPLITLTAWDAGKRDLAEGQSAICIGQIREGIVVESLTGPRRKAKFVGQGYLLRDENKPTAPKKDKAAKAAVKGAA